MKKCLIMVLSCTQSPYDKLAETSKKTWDSIDINGLETIYYFGQSDKANTPKDIYFPVHDHLFGIGHKDIIAFEWALQSKSWDYMARPNASAYVCKQRLFDYIQNLPDENVCAGLPVVSDEPVWIWGPFFILSRDVVEKIVSLKNEWNHSLIEDKAISELLRKINVQFTTIPGGSIDKTESGWQCTSYNTDSFTFTDFSEIIKADKQIFFRCKQDLKRNEDHYVMNQLFKYL